MSKLARAWRIVQELSWGQRWVLVEAWLMLVAVSVGLRVIGFRRVQSRVLAVGGAPGGRADLPVARALARIVHGTANWIPVHANCLARSLVLCRLLRHHNLDHKLRIGVHKPGGIFAAHAWVEHDGEALGEPNTPEEPYTAFDDVRLRRGV